MREQRPSQTAALVALARALADRGFTRIPHFSDPVVASLLSPGWATTFTALVHWMNRADPKRRDRAIAQFDVIPMRVRAIDVELEKDVARGCDQLVILGAGLDTRAFRLHSLATTAVFEVDHPATQEYKERKTQSLRVLAKSLAFVSIDFERHSLGERLALAGHRAGAPTIWVWEGVVMYLSDGALRGTLADVGRLSTRGSVLLLHYHEPSKPGLARLFARALLALWREPQIGPRSVDRMHEAVRAAGFDVESDSGPPDWAQAMGVPVPVGETARVTRLLVARRR
jgi:methyltransferase (TIGR00027 family)